MDTVNAGGTAACKSASPHLDGPGDEACKTCCKGQRATRGTVYGTGVCTCYDANSAVGLPYLNPSMGLKLTSDANPPSFELSGGSDGIMFVMIGPFADQASARGYNSRSSPGSDHVMWSLDAADVVAAGGSLPVIKYGTITKEFKERVGPAPALIPGQFYIARGAGTTHLVDGATPRALRHLCFETQATKVVEFDCGAQ